MSTLSQTKPLNRETRVAPTPALRELAEIAGITEEGLNYLAKSGTLGVKDVISEFPQRSPQQLSALIYLTSSIINQNWQRRIPINPTTISQIIELRSARQETTTVERMMEHFKESSVSPTAWAILEQLNIQLISSCAPHADLSPLLGVWGDRSIHPGFVRQDRDLVSAQDLIPSETGWDHKTLAAMAYTFSYLPPLSKNAEAIFLHLQDMDHPILSKDQQAILDKIYADPGSKDPMRSAISILREFPTSCIGVSDLTALLSVRAYLGGKRSFLRDFNISSIELAMEFHKQAPLVSHPDLEDIRTQTHCLLPRERDSGILRTLATAQLLGMISTRAAALEYAQHLLHPNKELKLGAYHISRLARRSGAPLDHFSIRKFQSCRTIGDSTVQRYELRSRAQFSNPESPLVTRELIESGNYPQLLSLIKRSEIDPKSVIERVTAGDIKNLVEPEWLAAELALREERFQTGSIKLNPEHLASLQQQTLFTIDRASPLRDVSQQIDKINLAVGFHHSDHFGYGLTHSLEQRSTDSQIAALFGEPKATPALRSKILEDGIVHIAATGELILPSRHNPRQCRVLFGQIAHSSAFMGLVLDLGTDISPPELITAIFYRDQERLRRAIMREIAGLHQIVSVSRMEIAQELANYHFEKMKIPPFAENEIFFDEPESRGLEALQRGSGYGARRGLSSPVRMRSTTFSAPPARDLRLSDAARLSLNDTEETLEDLSIIVTPSKFWQS